VTPDSEEQIMVEYFPGNYVWNLGVVAALNSGGLIDAGGVAATGVQDVPVTGLQRFLGQHRQEEGQQAAPGDPQPQLLPRVPPHRGGPQRDGRLDHLAGLHASLGAQIQLRAAGRSGLVQAAPSGGEGASRNGACRSMASFAAACTGPARVDEITTAGREPSRQASDTVIGRGAQWWVGSVRPPETVRGLHLVLPRAVQERQQALVLHAGLRHPRKEPPLRRHARGPAEVSALDDHIRRVHQPRPTVRTVGRRCKVVRCSRASSAR
jgi:hypothetical protein